MQLAHEPNSKPPAQTLCNAMGSHSYAFTAAWYQGSSDLCQTSWISDLATLTTTRSVQLPWQAELWHCSSSFEKLKSKGHLKVYTGTYMWVHLHVYNICTSIHILYTYMYAHIHACINVWMQWWKTVKDRKIVVC